MGYGGRVRAGIGFKLLSFAKGFTCLYSRKLYYFSPTVKRLESFYSALGELLSLLLKNQEYPTGSSDPDYYYKCICFGSGDSVFSSYVKFICNSEGSRNWFSPPVTPGAVP